MKNQDVKRKEFKKVTKQGLEDSKGNIIVPIEYDFIEQVNDNLFVATKGDLNGLRNEFDLQFFSEDITDFWKEAKQFLLDKEFGRPYGELFNYFLKNKCLDTEVEFYTLKGKIYSGPKILAAVACKNDNMFLLLHEDYKWSTAIIDYESQILFGGPYVDANSIKMDYDNNRFVITYDNEIVIVTFNEYNRITNKIRLLKGEIVKFCDKGIVIKKNHKYGFINYTGEEILNCVYDEVILEDTFIRGVNKGHVDLLLYTGEYIIGGEDYIWWKTFKVKDEKLTILKRVDNMYCLYSSNKQLLPCEYTLIDICDEFAIACNSNGEFGMFKYNEEADEMEAIFPESFPDIGYEFMRFEHKNDTAYVVADETITYDLVAFRD